MSIVPREIRAGADVITVGRAWPRSVSDDELRVRLEGRDPLGRLRAGEATLRRDASCADSGWTLRDARLTPFATDDRLPGLEGLRGDLVVHRVGRRAVVRRARDHVKVVRPDKVDTIVEAHATGALLAGRAGWGSPSAHPLPGRSGAVSLSTLPGVPLHDLGAGTDLRVVRRAWRTFAAGWPRLAGPGVLDLPAHDAAAEAELTVTAVRRALTVWAPPPELRDGILARLADVRAALLTDPGDPGAPSHRDLHDKQILVGERLGLLDLDTAALAEPELDLANLHEHVLLRGQQGLWSSEAVTAGVEGVAAAAATLRVDARRMAAYRAATRLRLASIYLFRPRWAAQAQGWLAAAVHESPLMESSPAGHARLGAWRT